MYKAEKYNEFFEQIYNSGVIIKNKKGDVFTAKEDEVFKQCWADTVTRRDFPMYWFISNKGNLLSVYGNKLVWLKENKRPNSNRGSYKFEIKTEDGKRNKNIETHNLVGLVWGSESFGKATKLLEEKGLYAFGVNSNDKIVVQGHHLNGDDDDNRPDNLKFVTGDVHIVIGKAPHPYASEEEHFAYMDKVAEVMGEENPNLLTFVTDGYVFDKRTGEWSKTGDCDVIAMESIELSSEATAQIYALLGLLNKKVQ